MSLKDGYLTEMEWASLRRTAEENLSDCLKEEGPILTAINLWRPRARASHSNVGSAVYEQMRCWINGAKAGRAMYAQEVVK